VSFSPSFIVQYRELRSSSEGASSFNCSITRIFLHGLHPPDHSYSSCKSVSLKDHWREGEKHTGLEESHEDGEGNNHGSSHNGLRCSLLPRTMTFSSWASWTAHSNSIRNGKSSCFHPFSAIPHPSLLSPIGTHATAPIAPPKTNSHDFFSLWPYLQRQELLLLLLFELANEINAAASFFSPPPWQEKQQICCSSSPLIQKRNPSDRTRNHAWKYSQ
jgi:hypothetical protein